MIFKNRSIKTKLIFITALSSCMALIAFSTTLFLYENHFAKQDLINNLQTQAEIIAENSLASLAFMDDSTTRKTLGALKHNPDILFAGLYNAQQVLLDAYRNKAFQGKILVKNEELLTISQIQENDDGIQLVHRIDLNGDLLGFLVLKASFESFNHKLHAYVSILFVSFWVSLMLALYLSSHLQRIVSNPIIRIADFIHTVTKTKSYNVQAIKESNDEFGGLVEAFNEMLQQLNLSFEQRDGAERALSHHLNHLQEIVDEQTRDLQKALKAADMANHSKSDFLANMSHEIRTPMNAIMGMTHLIQRTNLTEKQHDYLEKIDAAAQSLLAIINDILDFSKIEAGKMQLENAPFSLQKVLNHLLDMLKIKADQKGIMLTFNVSQDVPNYLLGDSLRLGQILLNLISNAVKFTYKGKVEVNVNARKLEQNSVELYFSVIDTGIGMNVEQLNRLFQPFSQADTSITRKFGGTGLGLTICKQLVNLMGGEIQVTSEIGKGSTFSFNVIHKLATEDFTLPDVTQNEQNLHQTYHKQRVLLVEDNEINQQVAMELLTSMGLDVRVANNGQEGLARALAEPFDLVLMDIQMPIMDGLTAASLIRKQKNAQELPIIAMTAHAMVGDKEKSLAAGMNDHLTKPIEMDKLIGMLNRWLSHEIELKKDDSKAQIISFLPQELPPFDLVKAVKFAGNDPHLLHQLLLSFAPRYENTPAQLQKLIAEKEYQQITHIAHSLKGVAGTLAANELRKTADALEFSLHCEHYENLDTLIAELICELNLALNAIKTLQPLPENQVANLDEANFSELLTKFNIALRSNHFNATDLFEQIKGYLSSAGLNTEVDELTHWLDELNFQAALPVLDRITLHFLKDKS